MEQSVDKMEQSGDKMGRSGNKVGRSWKHFWMAGNNFRSHKNLVFSEKCAGRLIIDYWIYVY
jgi:hypothetical protein